MKGSGVIEICYFLSGESKCAFLRLICHFLNTLFKTMHIFSFVCDRHRSGKSPFIPTALNIISNELDRSCNLFAASILSFLFLQFTKELYSNSCHFLCAKLTSSEPTFKSQIFCSELKGDCTYMNRFLRMKIISFSSLKFHYLNLLIHTNSEHSSADLRSY